MEEADAVPRRVHEREHPAPVGQGLGVPTAELGGAASRLRCAFWVRADYSGSCRLGPGAYGGVSKFAPRALGSLSLCDGGSSGRWGREARVLPFRCACYQLSAVGFCRTAVVVSKKQILNIRFVVRARVELSSTPGPRRCSGLSGAVLSLKRRQQRALFDHPTGGINPWELAK